MPFTENLDEFLDTTDGFADACTVGGSTLWGVFTQANSDALGVDGTRPTLLVKDASVSALSIAYGTSITITRLSQAFVVRSLQPDGTGMTLLILEESA